MSDLYLGLAILSAASVAVFGLSVHLTSRASTSLRTAIAATSLAAMLLFASCLWHNPLLAAWLPYSNLVVLGSWFPPFLAILAGCVWTATPSLPRRAILLGALLAAAFYSAAAPLMGEAPRCGAARFRDGYCQQTTQFTCSAASAVNLLAAHGIPASEQEMADLCLTRRGTSWLGLYRGLKLKTAGTAWDVEIVRCTPRQLRRLGKTPLILEVGLSDQTRVDATFREEFGWSPGQRHSVLLCGFDESSRARIVDPMPLIGQERWDSATLKLLFRGVAMRLVERTPVPRPAN